MEIDERLRSTSDQLLERIEQLRTLENEKRTVPPGSRHFNRLAREAERLANSVAAHAEDQTDLGTEAAAEDAATGETTPPIDETQRDVAVILAEWRDAERQAGAAAPGSAEEVGARKDALRLRDEYQRAHRSASRGQR